jgi:hypothetical protein
MIFEKSQTMLSRNELIKMTQRHIDFNDLDRILYVLEITGFIKKVSANKRDFWQATNQKRKP